MVLGRGVVLGALLTALAAAARAQEPAGAPPPAGEESAAGVGVHELLPGIGKLGAQVGLSLGASWNPYDVGQGLVGAAFVDLPILRAPGGKLSYELLVSLSDAESDPFTITDPVAFVANLAAGASREAALAGPPQAPFPVRREVRSQLRLLQVSPFGLKYTYGSPGAARVRPYAAAGVDVVVVITRQTPERDESLVFNGTSPFDDPLIAGLIAQAPELTERGYPTGQGDIRFGGHLGAGFELRASRSLSLNADYRFTAIEGRNGRLHTLTAALGLHW
jgi:opacity protein-like surface antigen